MDHTEQLAQLEQAIVDAETLKREFVKEFPTGTGDQSERHRIYNQVERARRALRDFKIQHPELVKRQF